MADSAGLWTPASGVSLILTRDPQAARPHLLWLTEAGTGLLTPNMQRWKHALQAGETLGDTNRPTRVLTMGCLLVADTYDQRDTFRGTLETAFNPMLGLGVLTVTRRDGVVRKLRRCLVTRGLTWETVQRMPTAYTVAIELEAFDPYWYDTTLTTKYDGLYTNAVAP